MGLYNDTVYVLSTQRSRLVSAWAHWLRWCNSAAIAMFGAVTVQQHFALGVNLTESLPHHVFLIIKGASVHRGDLMAFRWQGGGPYRDGVVFIKIAAGVPGDIVTRIERRYFVNGVDVGVAKVSGRAGQALAMMDTGALPAGCYYAMAPHPDSLDSRYALTGWIPENRILGRAYALL